MEYDYVFKLVEGGMAALRCRNRPNFSQRQGPEDPERYQFVAEEDAHYLIKQDYYERALDHVSGKRLGEILGGTADDAKSEIANGGADGDLDMVLYAERETKDRETVKAAIAQRSDELATQKAQVEETSTRLSPADVEI